MRLPSSTLWVPLIFAAFALPATAADEPSDTAVVGFLKRNCQSCHGGKKQDGGVRFDQLDGIRADNWNLWTMIHGKMASGEMPPKDSDQPTADERKQMLALIRDRQRALGVGGMRRLNRRELAASLRDVTGLSVDFAQSLPGDGTVAGFDTGAEGLQEAADAVALWLQVTGRAVDGLRFSDATKGKVFSAELRDSKDGRKAIDAWKADGASGKIQGVARPGVGLLIEPRSPGDRDELTFTVPAERQGVLRLTVVVSAYKPVAGVPHPRLWVRIGGRDLDYREITGALDKPQRLVYEVQLGDSIVQAKGITISLSNKVEVPYAADGFENEDKSNPKEPVPGGTGLFRPAFDRKALPLEKHPAPYIALQSIEIDPAFQSPWPPAEWKADVGAVKDDIDTAKRLLAVWMDRAWRRPVNEVERAPFEKLYSKLRADGMPFDGALRGAFQSVLVSAPFRYMASPGSRDATASQYAIASRLSYFLIGAPPDVELRTLAAAGKLREPAVLDAQVERLLADPRSDAFVRPFVTQWLELEQPITIAQDHIQKQDFRFARHLKASMREETIAYVARSIAENRPAEELIASDWTMMNDALARHYGYEAVAGGTLQKVKLRPDDPRGGGLLGHAGIQSMLCWMGDNWVIYRGAWALRHILDIPPPPPPLEVPELNPSEGKNKGQSFRALLKQHQTDNRCSVCHKNIDPVGFAFQNFDISGRWRDLEHHSYSRGELDGRISWVGAGKTRPVDSSGRLPRGEEFKTFSEFKTLIAKHYRIDLVRGLMKNFAVYATGRKPGIDEMAEIEDTLKAQAAKGYPLRELLKAVVRSRAFLEVPAANPKSQPSPDR